MATKKVDVSELNDDEINRALYHACYDPPISLTTLCKRLKCTPAGLRKWIFRKSEPSEIFKKALCRVLKMKHEELGFNDHYYTSEARKWKAEKDAKTDAIC